ncbi:MAG: PQQ-binding-like beta-propeller repeat protein [Halieaceae bacterium]
MFKPALFLLLTIFAALASAADSPTPTTDPDSMQAINAARAARESLPGRAHYEKACAVCHNGNVAKAPHRDMVGLLTVDAILNIIENGIMKEQASSFTAKERIELAEYLSGEELGQVRHTIPSCPKTIAYKESAATSGSNWGIQPANTRTISASAGGISSENVSSLKPKWTLAMPGASRMRSQPLLAGGLIFLGSHSGIVHALDQDTGCEVWSFQASGEVRTGIVLDDSGKAPLLYFGDVLANVYGVDARSGELVWRMRADDHPNATITGTPTPYKGAVFVPVSSLEVSLAANPQYECCTFRGSVVALDGQTGALNWKTYTIPDEPRVTGKNPIGTNIIGPSGAVVWNSPSIDSKNNQLFIGTGENMSSPASLTSDAMIAMDLTTGKINWVFQATENDVWNAACDTDFPENCPVENGPDFDFGGATIVVETTRHGRLVIAGQKSGFVHAIKPKSGELVWQTRVGRGGIQGGIHFGIAASGETLLVPISDMGDGRSYPTPDKPGMNALDANSGEILWTTLHEDNCGERAGCDPGISQVVTVIGDLVIGGAMDGAIRAYSIEDGKVVWEMDVTTAPHPSITGDVALGGSFGGAAGPIAFDGKLFISAGYGIYNHMPGNLFMVLEATR